jgi:hypothetical protein
MDVTADRSAAPFPARAVTLAPDPIDAMMIASVAGAAS